MEVVIFEQKAFIVTGSVNHKKVKQFCRINENMMSTTEAVIWKCSIEKVFLEISQNSQENTCARVSFLIKLQASWLLLLLENDIKII